jgi:hypothetical protein
LKAAILLLAAIVIAWFVLHQATEGTRAHA